MYVTCDISHVHFNHGLYSFTISIVLYHESLELTFLLLLFHHSLMSIYLIIVMFSTVMYSKHVFFKTKHVYATVYQAVFFLLICWKMFPLIMLYHMFQSVFIC